MAFRKLSIFTILLSVMLFECEGAGYPIYRRNVAETYDANKFVGTWYVIDILHVGSLPRESINCMQLKVQRHENNNFHMKFIGIQNQEYFNDLLTTDIANDKIYNVHNDDINKLLEYYTILDYTNFDEIVLQHQRTQIYFLLSRTLNISAALWKKYSDLAISLNGELVRVSHEDCA